jgi:hypothetical protein
VSEITSLDDSSKCWCGNDSLHREPSAGMTMHTWSNRIKSGLTQRTIPCARVREYAHCLHVSAVAVEREGTPFEWRGFDSAVVSWLETGGRCGDPACTGHMPEWESRWG